MVAISMFEEQDRLTKSASLITGASMAGGEVPA